MPDHLTAAARRNAIGDILPRTAARVPDKTALVYGATERTFAELDAVVARTASALTADGVARGDRFGIVARNSDEFAVLYLALARMGAVSVPVNFMLTADEIAYILDDAGCTGVAVATEFVGTVADALARLAAPVARRVQITVDGGPLAEGWTELTTLLAYDGPVLPAADVAPDELIQLLYTSGTESHPKGVMLTSAALMAQYTSVIVGGRMSADDVELHTLPLYHTAQLHCFLTPALLLGSTSIVHGRPVPARIVADAARYGVTKFFAPPTIWIALLAELEATPGADLSTLRKGYYGAAAMPVEVLHQLAERLPDLELWNFYGQTEMSPIATILEPAYAATKLGSAGRPALNVETRVVDDADQPVPTGVVGEIVHRSPQLMTGYWRRPDLTEAAFAGGWFHSGDLGVFDEDGFLTIVDRKKDMVNTGGENVASREVEECLYLHPAVAEAAVVGLPHPQWVEQVTAAVVLKPGAAAGPEDLRAHCAERLAGFKVPKQVVLVEALPKNASGKILKRDLRTSLL
ncbi:long-chain-fatty-acid--CoA ligase [Pimelobacter simplex]|uniref:Long-chain-fatty-acid--CoA ligase n=1 Tax=Nocardioides simplex TaxID=2045 RepID=A0A7J5E3V6_NOCSI|nr:fatty acyl-CoA synthetase [Pimelobacter simplex]KAB2812929.1 long-chain-fatty-acid--CoA ligase [Pimelobacter simplex]